MKRSLFLIILILLLPIAFACNELDYNISNIGKDNNGCYESLSIYITKENCTSGCFSEFNNFTFSTDKEILRTFNIENSGAISNPFYFVRQTINCTNGVPSTFYIDFTGERNCSLSFSLENEYQKLQDNKANITQEIPKEDNLQNEVSSPQQNIAAEQDPTPQTAVQAQDNNETLANPPSDIIYGNQENTQEFQNPAETSKKDYTLPLLIITAIILTIGVATLLILKKPKRRQKSRRTKTFLKR